MLAPIVWRLLISLLGRSSSCWGFSLRLLVDDCELRSELESDCKLDSPLLRVDIYL